MTEEELTCPACAGERLFINQEQLDVPHFGELMISTLICSRCGFRSTDVIPLQSRPPKRHTCRIDGPDKLRLRVVRSGSSTVIIPEIKARVDPGLYSEGYISNIEGAMVRFLGILEQLKRDLENSPGDISIQERLSVTDGLISRLRSITEGDDYTDPLTLVLEDPYGNSAIIPEKEEDVEEELLSDSEVALLLEGIKERNTIEEI
ncbi:MAG: ZPR1 zinc finger domain-containing protein [Thermoplasmatota archaeon]